MAHRRTLELALGRSLGEREVAMHSCDNPPCCNPAHLRAGTKADNSQDASRKGRMHHVLTVEQVVAIKRGLLAGRSPGSLARENGVTRTSIRNIVEGRSWRHVAENPSVIAAP